MCGGPGLELEGGMMEDKGRCIDVISGTKDHASRLNLGRSGSRGRQMLVLLSIIGQASTPSNCLCLLVQSSIISHIQRRIRTIVSRQ